MYHPAAALRAPAIERESYADIAAVPAALIDARQRREASVASATEPEPEPEAAGAAPPDYDDAFDSATQLITADDPAPQLTLF
jgi:hypothetical protein